MLHKMMRRFDASDEHIKDLRSDLVGIEQKVDTHAISIKQLELKMAKLSATVKTQKLGRLPSNTDPPMPSKEEKVIKDNDKVVEVSGEVEDNTEKDAEVPTKVTTMPRPPPFVKD